MQMDNDEQFQLTNKKEMIMKRNEFFNRIMSLDKYEEFGMTYKKKNGETRNARCRLCNEEIDNMVKGTGMNRQEKMDKLQVFQYFDINSNAYRSARLENIMEVIINEEVIKLED